MSPTPWAALALAAVAVSALFLPPELALLGALALAVAVILDARSVRRAPRLLRERPRVLSRGVAANLTIDVRAAPGARVRVRQATPPDLALEPAQADGTLDARIVGRRRGRHALPAAATRSVGPLGLGAWYHGGRERDDVLVYPDLVAARRLALAVRRGRFREAGRHGRGPLGLGTEFESIRDYLPDDDVRQVNWRATARLGRPMTNQYRIEQDRDVICVVDSGRLMTAPLGEMTRLDVALDAVTAVGLVADELGDRCGTLAFDSAIRREVRPRRKGGEAVVRALFDVEPTAVDSDYELAFRAVEGAKRAFVLVFTDLLEPSAAGSLVDAVPVLGRRHAVAVVSVADPEVSALVANPPEDPLDVYRSAVAATVLDARARAALLVRRAGAQFVEAPPGRLPGACVAAYLSAKARARL